MRVLGHLARHVVPNHRVQARHEHQTLLDERANSFLVRLQAADEVLLEAAHPVREQADAVQHVPNNERLEDVELEVAVHVADRGRDVVAHDLRGDLGEGFRLRRVDFSRHDGGPRFVLGEAELAEAAAGTRAEEADVGGEFEQSGCESVEVGGEGEKGIVGGEGREFVGGREEGEREAFGEVLGDERGEGGVGV